MPKIVHDALSAHLASFPRGVLTVNGEVLAEDLMFTDEKDRVLRHNRFAKLGSRPGKHLATGRTPRRTTCVTSMRQC